MTRTSRTDRPVRGDRGATLIIAIGFVVMIGAIAAGLSSLVVSAMGDRFILAELRDRQYAADGAIELAVAHVRSLDAAHGGTCSAPPGHIVDVLNEQSRTAILRLGAKQEGILRKHLILPNGRIRDSVIFSILDDEWPEVKQRLISALNQKTSP